MEELYLILQSLDDEIRSNPLLSALYQLCILAIIAATIAVAGWVMYLMTARAYQMLYAAGGF